MEKQTPKQVYENLSTQEKSDWIKETEETGKSQYIDKAEKTENYFVSRLEEGKENTLTEGAAVANIKKSERLLRDGVFPVEGEKGMEKWKNNYDLLKDNILNNPSLSQEEKADKLNRLKMEIGSDEEERKKEERKKEERKKEVAELLSQEDVDVAALIQSEKLTPTEFKIFNEEETLKMNNKLAAKRLDLEINPKEEDIVEPIEISSEAEGNGEKVFKSQEIKEEIRERGQEIALTKKKIKENRKKLEGLKGKINSKSFLGRVVSKFDSTKGENIELKELKEKELELSQKIKNLTLSAIDKNNSNWESNKKLKALKKVNEDFSDKKNIEVLSASQEIFSGLKNTLKNTYGKMSKRQKYALSITIGTAVGTFTGHGAVESAGKVMGRILVGLGAGSVFNYLSGTIFNREQKNLEKSEKEKLQKSEKRFEEGKISLTEYNDILSESQGIIKKSEKRKELIKIIGSGVIAFSASRAAMDLFNDISQNGLFNENSDAKELFKNVKIQKPEINFENNSNLEPTKLNPETITTPTSENVVVSSDSDAIKIGKEYEINHGAAKEVISSTPPTPEQIISQKLNLGLEKIGSTEEIKLSWRSLNNLLEKNFGDNLSPAERANIIENFQKVQGHQLNNQIVDGEQLEKWFREEVTLKRDGEHQSFGGLVEASKNLSNSLEKSIDDRFIGSGIVTEQIQIDDLDNINDSSSIHQETSEFPPKGARENLVSDNDYSPVSSEKTDMLITPDSSTEVIVDSENNSILNKENSLNSKNTSTNTTNSSVENILKSINSSESNIKINPDVVDNPKHTSTENVNQKKSLDLGLEKKSTQTTGISIEDTAKKLISQVREHGTLKINSNLELIQNNDGNITISANGNETILKKPGFFASLFGAKNIEDQLKEIVPNLNIGDISNIG